MRLTSEQLQDVMDKYKVDKLYSWSKVNTFMTSPYEYYLNYVLHTKPDIDNCAYAPMGSICHSTIEDFYSNKISYEGMINNFEDGWLTSIDICNLKFDRNDETKNESIGSKYKECLEHFFTHHNKLTNKVELERFVSAKIGDYVLQGYADAITTDSDGNYTIIDWKTSTKYTGSTLMEHSGQLTVYAIALNQLGVPLNKIKCCFNFLKYCTIEYEQANGTVKTRDVERNKIGEALQSNLKVWIKKLGYSDQMDSMLMQVIDDNGLDNMPQDIKDKYRISDCYVYVDITEESIKKWHDLIVSTIKDIEAREYDYSITQNEKLFWESEEQVKKESYYFATLCGYSSALHKPYKLYLDNLEKSKNGFDMFSGVGGETYGKSHNNNVGYSNDIMVNGNNRKQKIEDDLDLSWLEDL